MTAYRTPESEEAMTEEVKHAPIPWQLDVFVDGIDVRDKNGVLIAHMADREIGLQSMPPDNAKIIRDSVNNHKRLTDENEKLRAALSVMIGGCRECGGTGKVTEYHQTPQLVACPMCRSARAALASTETKG
jgi:hypothetical protein